MGECKIGGSAVAGEGQVEGAAPRKHAILLFSKPPVPGLVKTRLTPLKDGIFSPEVAAGLYHCMFFDVVEICCDALAQLEAEDARASSGVRSASDASDALGTSSAPEPPDAPAPFDTYDIFISTTPAENAEIMQHLFDESGTWPRELHIISDAGASFDEHYNDAFEQVFAQGYDSILSMGGDMPSLPRAAVVDGFRKLQQLCEISGGGIVLSPDQEMGVSIVGWTRDTDMSHTGVFYNADGLTVLPAYIQAAQAKGLSALWLETVVDVDTMADLHHNITLVQAIEYCARFQDLSVPWRTINALHEMGYDEVRVPPNELRDSRVGIDVPEEVSVDDRQLEDKYGVTGQQIKEWAEAAEHGEYPGKPTGEIASSNGADSDIRSEKTSTC